MTYKRIFVAFTVFVLLSGCTPNDRQTRTGDPSSTDAARQDHFQAPRQKFASIGRNRYFILEPGYQMVYDGSEDGNLGHLIVTVRDQTKIVDGVETRLVEERETVNGKLTEISSNYFAVDRATNDIYYFGEDSMTYKDGKVVSHEGSWLSGVDGAHYGLIMPASPQIGQRYYQEIAPGQTMDRAENLSLSAERKTPAGEFKDCLETVETSPVEPDSKEYKFYAPEVGLIVDSGLQLTKYGMHGQ